MKLTKRQKIMVAVGLAVVAYLAYRAVKRGREVLDPSNNASLDRLFDQQNPGLAGTGDA